MKDDKKKVMVLVALFVVILSVGAFQMLGGSAPAPAPKKEEKKKDDKAKEPETKPSPNPEFVNSLPERDPFAVPTEAEAKPDKDATTPPTPPTEAPLPAAKKSHKRTSIPPVNPIDMTGGAAVLPAPNGATTPPPVVPVEPVFGYTLSGVIVGEKPAAVFNDAQGNQRLIPVGGSLDGDTKLIEVSKGGAVVSFHGKTLRLMTGGIHSEN